MNSCPSGAPARREVLGAELFLESALKRGDFLGRVFGYALLRLGKRVDNVVGVLVAWAIQKSWLALGVGGQRDGRTRRQTYAGIVAVFTNGALSWVIDHPAICNNKSQCSMLRC